MGNHRNSDFEKGVKAVVNGITTIAITGVFVYGLAELISRHV